MPDGTDGLFFPPTPLSLSEEPLPLCPPVLVPGFPVGTGGVPPPFESALLDMNLVPSYFFFFEFRAFRAFSVPGFPVGGFFFPSLFLAMISFLSYVKFLSSF
jgi:hypothetical protein